MNHETVKRFWHVAIVAVALAIFANQRFCAEPALALPAAADGRQMDQTQTWATGLPRPVTQP